MPADLPSRPDLEHLRKQAKALLRDYRAGDALAAARFASPGARRTVPKLADAQRLIAVEYGFSSWAMLKEHVLSLVIDGADPVELIKTAFREDDAALVRKVLQRHPALKAKVNEPLFPFDSPAITFARSRAMLDVLLDAGADINAKSRWWAGGFGILHGADPALAAYAVRRGAVVDAHAAARLGMLDRLRELVAADPSLVHARGGDGQTPLHFAASVEIAEYLLENGARIDATDIDHESTPAQHMLKDRQPVVKYLVRRGCRTDILMAAALGDPELVRKHLDADPASIRMRVSERYFPKRDPRAGGCIYIWTLGHNKTAHQVARDFGHDDIFRLVIERSPVELRLSQAMALGERDTVDVLLAGDPDLVRKLTPEDQSELVHAAQNNDAQAVRRMLAAGWPADARGRHNGTALHWAAFHGNTKMIEEILGHHPPLDDADNEFRATPLGWATHGSEHGWYCKTGDYAGVVELLCAAGAKLPKDFAGTEAVKEVLRRYQSARG
jgi:ankyrin repeat protein